MDAEDFGDSVFQIFDRLYGHRQRDFTNDVGDLAAYYMEEMAANPRKLPIPQSLHAATSARYMADPTVAAQAKYPFVTNELLHQLGIVSGYNIKGPLNHILARLVTVPMMLGRYIDNYPTDPAERAIYTDPPLLQLPKEELIRINGEFFAEAAEVLAERKMLVEILMKLGELGQKAAESENEKAYPAYGSTEAYELFGIFHMFPDNRQVDVTATSPGVILPTEADPLRFKDSVPGLRKNLLRPPYFTMLTESIATGGGRRRRYSASRAGTAKALREYPHLAGAAKELLSRYLELGDAFEIRLGEQDPRMAFATLIGDMGVVYSVRDPAEKDKIAHNVTVMDAAEAGKHRQIFEEQWAKGVPIKSTDVIDDLSC